MPSMKQKTKRYDFNIDSKNYMAFVSKDESEEGDYVSYVDYCVVRSIRPPVSE